MHQFSRHALTLFEAKYHASGLLDRRSVGSADEAPDVPPHVQGVSCSDEFPNFLHFEQTLQTAGDGESSSPVLLW